MEKYNPKEIEEKWQKKWEKDKLYQTPSTTSGKKFYVLDFFPYPSAEGLHVGHLKGYIATDVIARYLRMAGYNILHPMGWDAFGLPAENYAIKTGVHPAVSTAKNVEKIKAQMKRTGFSYDWSKEINTTDPQYYKWTQWIFLKMFEKGLAYERMTPINFCPSCKTGLANEEVVSGACERCGTKVTKKEIRQWILRITAYADRLLADLDDLDWPESIVEMQKNWIGRSEGVEIDFKIEDRKEKISVFTTRLDTIFSGTFIILSPEHPLIPIITTAKQKSEVEKYIKRAKELSDVERTEKGITGVFTGSYAVNPATEDRIPIWVADFVLMGYGTGAVYGDVHDERDFEMAKTYQIPLKVSIRPRDEKLWQKVKNLELPYTDDGILVNSGQFNGLTSEVARKKILEWLAEKGEAYKRTNFKLRDWIFSRQRYWGEPIPLVFCQSCKKQVENSKKEEKFQFNKGELSNPGWIAIPEKELPLKLPEIESYKPTGTGESPLEAITEWVNTTCPKCDGNGKRETNTMPQWAGSCWYYLRFIDPKNDKRLVEPKSERYWMGGQPLGLSSGRRLAARSLDGNRGEGGVDWYVGGAEHAVLHLLYARFWHKFLFNLGVVSTPEPFAKLRNVGLVLGEGGAKMSKSRGNVISPDEIIEKYGADTLRLYEGFMGPFEQQIAWDPKGIDGVWRFLNRVWNLAEEVKKNPHPAKTTRGESKGLEIAINELTKKVEEHILAMKFNTAIASMMEFVNLAYKNQTSLSRGIMRQFVLLISSFAPHIGEEMWTKLGGKYSVHKQKWPKFAAQLREFTKKTIVVQVNGRLRDKLGILGEIKDDELRAKATLLPRVQKYLNNKKIKNVIIVPGRLVNIVTTQNSYG